MNKTTTRPRAKRRKLARRMWADAKFKHAYAKKRMIFFTGPPIPVAVLDLSDLDRLVEVVAKVVSRMRSEPEWSSSSQIARAALSALGVLGKR